jgi:hypothetical protein
VVNVASNAPVGATNSVTISGGNEQNTANNSASDPTTVNAGALTLRQQVQTVRTNLTSLLSTADTKTSKSLQKAIAKLDQALASDLWQADGNHLTIKGETAFHRLREAVKELVQIKNPPAGVIQAITTLVTVSRTLAEQAISEAAGGDIELLTKAQKEMTKAQQDLTKNKPAEAMSHYEEAWEDAQQAGGIVLTASVPDDLTAEDEAEHVHEEESSTDETQTNRLFLSLVTR